MYTEKIAVTLCEMVRHDLNTGMKLYESRNTGASIYTRLNKVLPLPGPMMKGDTKQLRMMYTSCWWWIDVHRDR